MTICQICNLLYVSNEGKVSC